jgi:hypothetical protein
MNHLSVRFLNFATQMAFAKKLLVPLTQTVDQTSATILNFAFLAHRTLSVVKQAQPPVTVI